MLLGHHSSVEIVGVIRMAVSVTGHDTVNNRISLILENVDGAPAAAPDSAAAALSAANVVAKRVQ